MAHETGYVGNLDYFISQWGGYEIKGVYTIGSIDPFQPLPADYETGVFASSPYCSSVQGAEFDAEGSTSCSLFNVTNNVDDISSAAGFDVGDIGSYDFFNGATGLFTRGRWTQNGKPLKGIRCELDDQSLQGSTPCLFNVYPFSNQPTSSESSSVWLYKEDDPTRISWNQNIFFFKDQRNGIVDNYGDSYVVTTLDPNVIFANIFDDRNKHMYLVATQCIFDDESAVVRVYWVKTDANKNNIEKAVLLWKGTTTHYLEPGEPTPSEDTGDVIDIDAVPSIDFLDSGFIRAYVPTIAELNQIAGKMWDNTFLENIKKMFQNPMNAIISLNLVPGIEHVTKGARSNVIIGVYDTTYSAETVAKQYFSVDMGSRTIPKEFGNFLDYAPYTFVQLFLPYIGMIELNTEDVVGHKVSVKYKCDILTGQLVATILIDDSVYNQYQGNFSMSAPMTGGDFSSMYMGVVRGGSSVVGGAISLASGNVSGFGQIAGGAMGLVQGAVGSVEYSRGSNMTMSSGYLGKQGCFMIVSRPKTANTIPTGFDSANRMLDNKVHEYKLLDTEKQPVEIGPAGYVLVVSGLSTIPT